MDEADLKRYLSKTETEDDDTIVAVDEGTESHTKLEAVLVLKHEIEPWRGSAEGRTEG
ncbi:hypothetical protein PIB30_096572 [Stylosanthes scabra]|uniref:Uncharacterized protein n=1 Tax=Stylosanthes scabra TaxID=79078 RepID=A0ABU6WZ31_9FABA|nr:hypothetical protein [Stylosanthes scabra]